MLSLNVKIETSIDVCDERRFTRLVWKFNCSQFSFRRRVTSRGRIFYKSFLVPVKTGSLFPLHKKENWWIYPESREKYLVSKISIFSANIKYHSFGGYVKLISTISWKIWKALPIFIRRKIQTAIFNSHSNWTIASFYFTSRSFLAIASLFVQFIRSCWSAPHKLRTRWVFRIGSSFFETSRKITQRFARKHFAFDEIARCHLVLTRFSATQLPSREVPAQKQELFSRFKSVPGESCGESFYLHAKLGSLARAATLQNVEWGHRSSDDCSCPTSSVEILGVFHWTRYLINEYILGNGNLSMKLPLDTDTSLDWYVRTKYSITYGLSRNDSDECINLIPTTNVDCTQWKKFCLIISFNNNNL